MTAKAYLSQAFYIDQRINAKLAIVQSLRNLATKATTTLSDMPKGSSRNVSRMSDIIAKMVDLEEEINADIDELVDCKREIDRLIGLVENPTYRTILELRYLAGKPLDEVGIAMNYEYSYLTRLHKQALGAIEKLLPSGKISNQSQEIQLETTAKV
jgi:DNA-directed RNA polymerase specialized sigma subunit